MDQSIFEKRKGDEEQFTLLVVLLWKASGFLCSEVNLAAGWLADWQTNKIRGLFSLVQLSHILLSSDTVTVSVCPVCWVGYSYIHLKIRISTFY